MRQAYSSHEDAPNRIPIEFESGSFLDDSFHEASVGQTLLHSGFDLLEKTKVELALQVPRDFDLGLP